ncbi:hypothetical protein [Alcanivorax sp. 1008]|uniref:hypothetical protein n=1 Tax=Alcanivorax sp. 1008 TaxID=2816853 RepID=UPI001DF6F0A0|nr:hypothetical protein [Alcanivorax sp. 1008]MCC1496744.1 hypothetical protein [Alcanivorax sp. 1008]
MTVKDIGGVTGLIGKEPARAAGKALEMRQDSPVAPAKMIAGLDMLKGSSLDRAAQIPLARDALPHITYIAAGGGVTGEAAKYATKKLIEARTPRAEREDLSVAYERSVGVMNGPGVPPQ